MELNGYGDFSNHHCKSSSELELKKKYITKEPHDIESVEQIMNRKDEFDHTLLPPEYIRDPNNFIIDLMSFPKSVTTSGNPDGNSDNVLADDLQFHNALFTESTTERNNHDHEHHNHHSHQSHHSHHQLHQHHHQHQEHDSRKTTTNAHVNSTANVYMPINSDFLMPVTKTYNPNVQTVESVVEESGVKVVEQILLTETNVTLDDASVDDDSCDISRFNSRKVLPHKKRISRKLKIVQNESDLQLNVPLEDHKLPHVQQIGTNLGVPAFRCELCGQGSCSQLEFFAHLKQHYEPTTPDTILAAMKTSLDALGPEKSNEAADLCTIDKKTDSIDQVFHDVHFPFEHFPSNDDIDTVRVHIMEQHQNQHQHTVEPVTIKMGSTTLEEALNVTTASLQNQRASVQSLPTPTEVSTVSTSHTLASEEFSDTEDMLEGIRDKVFIEDTCDTMDLMTPTSNGVRSHWFNGTCFNGIELKTKPFCDVLFSGEFAPHILNTEQNATTCGNELASDKSLAQDNLSDSVKEHHHHHQTTRSTNTNTPEHQTNTETSLGLSLTHNDIIDHADIIISNTECSTDSQKLNSNILSIPIHSEKVFKNVTESCNQCSSSEGKTVYTLRNSLQRLLKPEYNSPIIENNNEMENDIDDVFDENDIVDDQNTNDIDHNENEVEIEGSNNMDGRKRYICMKCNRIFNSCNALKYHHRTHSGLRPHQCDICGKSFFAISALKAHTRTHTGDKPFECVHCDRKFRQWSDLKYHIVSIHSNEKNHQCEFCGKAFSRKYSLVVHLRIHTRERNYKCEFCTKTFRASTYLQNHRKIHTGEKPYECNVCSKRFRVSGDLRRHQRIHERKKLQENFHDTIDNRPIEVIS